MSAGRRLHRQQRDQPGSWEHDGTNAPGISADCQICGRLLIPTAEHGLCSSCLDGVEQRIKAGIEAGLKQFWRGKKP